MSPEECADCGDLSARARSRHLFLEAMRSHGRFRVRESYSGSHYRAPIMGLANKSSPCHVVKGWTKHEPQPHGQVRDLALWETGKPLPSPGPRFLVSKMGPGT